MCRMKSLRGKSGSIVFKAEVWAERRRVLAWHAMSVSMRAGGAAVCMQPFSIRDGLLATLTHFKLLGEQQQGEKKATRCVYSVRNPQLDLSSSSAGRDGTGSARETRSGRRSRREWIGERSQALGLVSSEQIKSRLILERRISRNSDFDP